jgi:hypothetical protein
MAKFGLSRKAVFEARKRAKSLKDKPLPPLPDHPPFLPPRGD